MLFWIIALALSLAVMSVIALAGLRARAGNDRAESADLPVYRAQLAEVENDAARGVIGPEEAERLRNEIARRLLAADAAAGSGRLAGGRMPMVAVAVIGLAVLGVGGGLYYYLGAPGYGDMPLQRRLAEAAEYRDTRPTQAEVEAQTPVMTRPEISEEFQSLMERLRKAVAERPDDLQGQRLLARNEASLGNAKAAYAAQARVIELLGDSATPEDFVTYGEMLVMAAGGYVSPQAEQAFRTALARDPDNGAAQYFLGVMWRQTGRPDIAFRIWDGLLRRGPEDAPWIRPIRSQIDEVAAMAGARYEQPAPAEALSGPSAADVEAAQDMSAEDRQEMIRGMVSRLSERLATQGGTAQEWARLISAHGVLGDLARARAIRDEALQVFAGNPDDLALIRAAGERAGLTE